MELLEEMLTEELKNANNTIADLDTAELEKYLETEEYKLMQEIEYNESINELRNLYS